MARALGRGGAEFRDHELVAPPPQIGDASDEVNAGAQSSRPEPRRVHGRHDGAAAFGRVESEHGIAGMIRSGPAFVPPAEQSTQWPTYY